MRFAEATDRLRVASFRIGVLLLDKRDPAETAHESGDEIIVRQIAFKAYLLFAIAVEKEHGRRPHCAKAMEPCRMFLDVSLYGQKVLMDKIVGLLVLIRLGIQPSTSPSSGSRAEVQQYGLGLLLRCGEGLIDILAPIHSHVIGLLTQ